MADREDLVALAKSKIDTLGRADLDVVIRFIDSISASIDFVAGTSPSWLTPGWFDAFTARLRAHHAISLEALSRTQFEAAFNSACMAEGWPTQPAASATHRFFDTTVVGPDSTRRTISLKASAARDLRPEFVHISKLTEAAWIQDERTQVGRRKKIVDLFREYRKACSSIIVLRAFANAPTSANESPSTSAETSPITSAKANPDSASNAGTITYELVEIPTTIFAAVDKLTVHDAQAATINLPVDQRPPDYKIRVDRSDSKITLTGIRLSVCIVHGRWHMSSETHGGL